MGNLGITSGEEIYHLLRTLRSIGAPLRVLDLHSNPLCASETPETSPLLGSGALFAAAVASSPGPLRALAELCDWIGAYGSTLERLNLREVMRDDASAEQQEAATRLLCAALASEHCALLELNVHTAATLQLPLFIPRGSARFRRGSGEVRRGSARFGEVRRGSARFGEVRRGSARFGEVRRGSARFGEVRRG
jgi:hypothetical protein